MGTDRRISSNHWCVLLYFDLAKGTSIWRHKAIGMGMGKLSGIVSGQVSIVACLGVCIAKLLTFGMAAALPQTMPFYLPVIDAIIVTAAFIVISFASSMLSIRRIARIDPLKSIGGAEK